MQVRSPATSKARTCWSQDFTRVCPRPFRPWNGITGLVTKAAGCRPPDIPDSDPFLASRLILRRWVKTHVSELLPGLDSLECGPPGKVEEEGPPSCLSSNEPPPSWFMNLPCQAAGPLAFIRPHPRHLQPFPSCPEIGRAHV